MLARAWFFRVGKSENIAKHGGDEGHFGAMRCGTSADNELKLRMSGEIFLVFSG